MPSYAFTQGPEVTSTSGFYIHSVGPGSKKTAPIEGLQIAVFWSATGASRLSFRILQVYSQIFKAQLFTGWARLSSNSSSNVSELLVQGLVHE